MGFGFGLFLVPLLGTEFEDEDVESTSFSDSIEFVVDGCGSSELKSCGRLNITESFSGSASTKKNRKNELN